MKSVPRDGHGRGEYRRESVELGDIGPVAVLTASRSAVEGRPSEDCFAVLHDGGRMLIGVFDGTTTVVPIPRLGGQTGAYFASHHLCGALRTTVVDGDLRGLAEQLNSSLLVANRRLGGDLRDTHTLPASTGTLVNIDADTGTLSFAHLGDSFAMVERNGGCVRLTDDRNRPFDREIFALIENVAMRRSCTHREARDTTEVRRAVEAMFQRRNNARDGRGSGLFNGDPEAMRYLQTGSIPTQNLAAVLVMTDGMVPPGIDAGTPEGLRHVMDVVARSGFEGLVAEKVAGEDGDPSWMFTRYKHSDDATGVALLFPT